MEEHKTYSIGTVAKKVGVPKYKLRQWCDRYLSHIQKIDIGDMQHRRFMDKDIELIISPPQTITVAQSVTLIGWAFSVSGDPGSATTKKGETTMKREILEKPFDPAQIKQRVGTYGNVLDYVEGHTVIQRLNDAFSNLNRSDLCMQFFHRLYLCNSSSTMVLRTAGHCAARIDFLSSRRSQL